MILEPSEPSRPSDILGILYILGNYISLIHLTTSKELLKGSTNYMQPRKKSFTGLFDMSSVMCSAPRAVVIFY